MENPTRPMAQVAVKPFLPFAALLLFVFCARLPLLHRAVLDWDETIYFLMAQAWLHGHLPYTTVWDNKPPGIYVIFAVFQALIPGVEAIRIATVLCNTILAWSVSEITFILCKNRFSGWVSAGIIVLCSLSNDGLAANTEPFMDCFTALAVLAVLRDMPAWMAGLLLGCGFMVKYVCAPEILVVLGLLWQRNRAIRPVIVASLAATLPFLAIVLLYGIAGRLPLLWNCAIQANFRRAEVSFNPYRLKFQAARWGGLYVVAAWAAVHAKRLSAPTCFLPAWLLAALIGAVSAKSFYDHYFLQMLPPLGVTAGLIFARLPSSLWPRIAFLSFIVVQPIGAAYVTIYRATGLDEERVTAALIRQARAKSLYVFDAQPMLYALTGVPAPTYYPFPPELIGVWQAKVAGVDPVKEVGRILAMRPEFIVCNRWNNKMPEANRSVYAELYAVLAAHYKLWQSPSGNDIYKLK